MKDFHELMQELGELMDIELIPDKHNACCINFNDEVTVQIEPASDDQHLLIASFIGELPAGKYRENILGMGLKYNHTFPRMGTFSYCNRNNKLAFFRLLPLDKVTPEILAEFLPNFLEDAKKWKEALDKGNLPTLDLDETVKKPTIFDIKQKT